MLVLEERRPAPVRDAATAKGRKAVSRWISWLVSGTVVVMASVVVDIVSYHVVYVLCLAAALAISVARGHASGMIVAAAVLFVLRH